MERKCGLNEKRNIHTKLSCFGSFVWIYPSRKLKRTKCGGTLASARVSPCFVCFRYHRNQKKEVQEAGLLAVENIPDEQAGEEQVPFELEEDLLEQQLEELEDDDMPDLEEELPPYVTVEKDDDPSRAQPPPPLLTSELPPENQPELPGGVSGINQERKLLVKN